jgi:4-azaleucine resistance transporter AzlC
MVRKEKRKKHNGPLDKAPGNQAGTAPLYSCMAQGFSAAWPICAAYLPIGLAFGVSAQRIGLSPLEIGLMSLFVFAGSAQFIAVSMIGSGAGPASIILATFVVNLRHLLMSSALSVFLGKSRTSHLALFAYGVTDESFAVNHHRFLTGDWDAGRALVVNHASNLAWVASTVAGGLGGQFIAPGAFGLDYTLAAMFIGLIVLQVNRLLHVAVGGAAGAISVALSFVLPGNWNIIAASIAAATAGAVILSINGRSARRPRK